MRKISIAKFFFTGLALLFAQLTLHAQNGSAAATPSSGSNMMMMLVYALMLALPLGLALVLLHLSATLKLSGTIKRIAKGAIALLVLSLAAPAIYAQTGTATAETPATSSTGMSNLMLIVISLLLLLSLALALMVLRLTNLLKQQNLPAGAAEPKGALSSWWADLDKKFFTKAVPVEKEADVLLDHDYDGIKELDNALPPWWKWGFYITVILAVIYMFRFHMGGNGPSPEQEYAREMKLAEAQKDAYLKKAGNMVDEKTVKLADKAGIAAGKALYEKGACVTCHLATGAGNIGPNLTDDYWLHGGTINDVFKTIKVGVPEKGMQAWEKTYSPTEIQNIASYILSLRGTNPPGAKAPQGTLFVPDAPKADSAGAKKDTVVAVAAATDAKPAK